MKKKKVGGENKSKFIRFRCFHKYCEHGLGNNQQFATRCKSRNALLKREGCSFFFLHMSLINGL